MLVILTACGRVGFTELDAIDGDAVLGDGANGDADVECSAAFDICDGFEAGLDSALWMTTDAMVALDTTFAHRGSTSVRVRAPASAANTNNYHGLSEARTLSTGITTFWVRAWLRMSALPATGNGMEILTAETPSADGDFVFVRDDHMSVYSQYGGGTRMNAAPPPIGTWFCLIFKIVRSTAPTGSLELTGDVPPISMTNAITDDAAIPMSLVNFGIGFASGNTPSAQPAIDVWVDDVIVHSAAVTCAD